MSNIVKTPIFIDEEKINNHIQPQENRIEYFQKLVNLYLALEIPEPLETKDLEFLVNNPKELITKKLIKEEDLSVNGLKLNLEKTFDIIEKPYGTEELINRIINDRTDKALLINHRNVLNFEIIEGNTVVLKPSYLDIITDQYTVYIETENQNKAFELVTEIAEKYNELKQLSNAGNFKSSFQELEEFIQINSRTDLATVNPYFIKKIRP